MTIGSTFLGRLRRSAWYRRRRFGASFGFVAAMMLVLPPLARGGGLYMNELSTTAQANAGAGRVAWAPDASATLHNPALMTELSDHGFAAGFSLVFGNVHFDADAAPDPSTGTGNGGNQAGIAPLASMSYVHVLSDRVRLGFSFYSISGSVLDPSNDWAGRYQMTELSLLTISLSPVVAVRVTDWLSVGAGPVISYGVLDWKLKAPLPFPPGAETKVHLDELDDWQAAARIGVTLKPHEDVSLGVYYNSETKFELSGNVQLGGLGPGNLDTDMPLAQFVEVGAHWQVSDRLALLASFDWEDWSAADDLDITIGGNRIAAGTGFEDTYKVGLGANYRAADDWLIQGGVAFDTSAFRNKDRTAAIPIDRQVRVSIGAQHEISDALTLGGSFTYVNLGSAEIRANTVRGDYQDNDLFILGLTLAFDRLPWNGMATFAGTNP
ncbi:MAG: outer membrane protein transport protein [Myxococcota bacterium]